MNSLSQGVTLKALGAIININIVHSYMASTVCHGNITSFMGVIRSVLFRVKTMRDSTWKSTHTRPIYITRTDNRNCLLTYRLKRYKLIRYIRIQC